MVIQGNDEVCKLTSIIIDHGATFLQPSGSKLEFDPSFKARANQTKADQTVLNKTTWSCVVEGVIEYTRVVYDLFPASFKV